MSGPLPSFAQAIACGLMIAGGLSVGGCATVAVPNVKLTPSNLRPWREDLAVSPTAEFTAETITLRGVRDCQYVGPNEYVKTYRDWSIRLTDIQTVDFLLVPFADAPLLAHTMLSFGLADGRYLTVSAEVRLEEGHEYGLLPGLLRQFELCYVLAEERDLIRLRTRHRDVDVLLYPTVATPEQAQALFLDVTRRINELAAKPEFYDTVTNNCTTNLTAHLNRVFPGSVPWSVSVLLPGMADRYAYELGLLGKERPFTELRVMARVNELADEYYDDPQFSQRIRRAIRRPQPSASSPGS